MFARVQLVAQELTWGLLLLSYGAPAAGASYKTTYLANPSALQTSVKRLTRGGDFRGHMSAVQPDLGAVLSRSNWL